MSLIKKKTGGHPRWTDNIPLRGQSPFAQYGLDFSIGLAYTRIRACVSRRVHPYAGSSRYANTRVARYRFQRRRTRRERERETASTGPDVAPNVGPNGGIYMGANASPFTPRMPEWQARNLRVLPHYRRPTPTILPPFPPFLPHPSLIRETLFARIFLPPVIYPGMHHRTPRVLPDGHETRRSRQRLWNNAHPTYNLVSESLNLCLAFSIADVKRDSKDGVFSNRHVLNFSYSRMQGGSEIFVQTLRARVKKMSYIKCNFS